MAVSTVVGEQQSISTAAARKPVATHKTHARNHDEDLAAPAHAVAEIARRAR